MALSLLFNGQVSEIHLNDIDRSIWAFWHSSLNHNEALIDKILSTPIDIEQWHLQRQVYLNMDSNSDLDVGFATFFLNRTNRSGIIKGAGVIGGLDQTGDYKIDCRFNRADLARRVRRVGRYRSQIHLYRSDALGFIGTMASALPGRSFFCIDPPYFNKGSSLYTSFYDPADHLAVSQAVLQLDRPWILTYDNTPAISQLYLSRRQYSFDVSYSIQTKRIGTELLVASKGLKLPSGLRDRAFHRPQYRSASSTRGCASAA